MRIKEENFQSYPTLNYWGFIESFIMSLYCIFQLTARFISTRLVIIFITILTLLAIVCYIILSNIFRLIVIFIISKYTCYSGNVEQ